jgi:phenylacetate-CoA ligase
MPFIRYENGDLVALHPDSCSCGFGFPLIGKVCGRTADILQFRNGRSLTGPGATLIFKEMEIQAWQVVQTGASQMEVRLMAKSHLTEAEERYICDVLRHHLTEEVFVQIRYVDRLVTTAGGKLKPVFIESNGSPTTMDSQSVPDETDNRY